MVYKNDYLHERYGDSAPAKSQKASRIYASQNKSSVRRPKYKLRKWLFAVSVAVVIFALLFGQTLGDFVTVAESSSPTDIKQAGQEAGLNLHGQAFFLSNNPEFVSADMLASVCPHEKEVIEYGCYLPSSHKIYILQISDSSLQPIRLTAIAHETLHAIWNDMSAADHQTLSTDLTAFYNSNESQILTDDAKPYQANASVDLVNELHSLAGSEVSITDMPSSLRSHFNEFFSDQSKTVEANTSFYDNIENQIHDINNQNNQLDTESQNLADFRSAHIDTIKAYMQQNLYYGDTYTYNLNVDAYNHNREIYNNMVSQYNADLSTYNRTRQNFIDAYSSLFPGRTLPVAGARQS